MTLGRTTRRALGLAALAALAALLTIGCSGDSEDGDADAADPSDDSGQRRQDAVEVVAESLVEYPRALYESDDEPRCIAEEVVDRFGVDRLVQLGLDIDGGVGPELFVPGLTEPERDELAAAYDACLDMQARDVESFTSEGLTEDQALCVSRAYRGSGIPRSHQTEPPHSGDLSQEPERVRQAHALLDELLTVLKAACGAWIPPGTSPGETP